MHQFNASGLFYYKIAIQNKCIAIISQYISKFQK